MSAMRYLPEGLVEGCKMKRAVAKDQVLTYDAVELPEGRLADRLRAEQYRHFGGATWLEEHLQRTQGEASNRKAAFAGESFPHAIKNRTLRTSPFSVVPAEAR